MHKRPYSGFRSFISYVNSLKKDWNVAVYDIKTRKRAVGSSLPDAVKKLSKKQKVKDVVIIDRRTAQRIKKRRRS
ncbi:MAG: hypothetical protein QY314_01820 [Candidatus Dojkabacteria bacterium]|nr:MAG: hypothetical protein QY314_01820 [Candidatus Dojkabacteria bacterium]